jgi:hypothetical protein
VNLSATDLGLLAAPFAAGLVVLATHVPLGITVLRRGIIFIDLAVAQVAALGVIVAGLVHLDERWGGFGTQLAAGIAALGAAALLTFCERRWPEIQEALIGLLFVFAAAAGILLLAGNPHGGEHLRDLLAGQILWAGWGQIGRRGRAVGGRPGGPGMASRVAAAAKAGVLRAVCRRRHRLGTTGGRTAGVCQPDRPGGGDARPVGGWRHRGGLSGGRGRLCAWPRRFPCRPICPPGQP